MERINGQLQKATNDRETVIPIKQKRRGTSKKMNISAIIDELESLPFDEKV